MTRRRVMLALLVVAAVAAVTGLLATRPDGRAATPPAPVVFAAASLSAVLPAIEPGARYSFGGSNAVSAQVEHGAPADVIASADPAITARLHARGLVEKPVAFARNRLVVIVPRSNPARVRSVRDLARRGVAVDLAAPAVPAGGYALRALGKLGLAQRVLANVVGREPDVGTVVAKVVVGQADAGIVYATDARSVGPLVRTIPIPARAQPNAVYTAAVVTSARHPEEARALVRALAGADARRALVHFGFLPLPS